MARPTYRELEARIAALEAQVALLASRVSQQPLIMQPPYPLPWHPHYPYSLEPTITCSSTGEGTVTYIEDKRSA